MYNILSETGIKVIVTAKIMRLEINEEKTKFTIIQREPATNDQN